VQIDDPRLSVLADGEKLQQILLNLLSNAIKFTTAAGTIRVSAIADGSDALIRVEDSGIGIPAEKLDAVFEPFVQLQTHGPKGREGTGLGLAISRDLARGMGGDLTVSSTIGVGSTFTLRLPRLP
jgi:signal transduction histidine kinase